MTELYTQALTIMLIRFIVVTLVSCALHTNVEVTPMQSAEHKV